MSKGKKDARQAARELAAAQRRAEQRRKRIIVATSAVGAVVLVLAILVAVKLTQPKKTTHDAQATATASTQLVSAVTGVSPAVLDQAGKGAVETLPAATHGQPVLKDSAGKPIVFYMGAEYCPYCAAERWAMIVALSRFGTFKDLKTTSSSSSDVYPNTPTFSFHGATYSSPYVDFQSKEVQSASGVALETLTADQQRIVNQFDSDGSFPFITFGNQATVTGASFNPQLLAGMTQEQIAQKLADPTSDIGKAILGTANAFTDEICKLTNGQPANVCSTSAAKAFGATGGQG